MRSQAIVQLALIIISCVIIFTYIRPAYSELQMTQEEADEYRAALDNADQFNQELSRLLNRAESFSPTQISNLDRYLPTEVDVLSVMRDINLIVERNDMLLTGLGSEQIAEESEEAASGQGQEVGVALPLKPTQLQVSVQGPYQNFKSLLRDFERNAYPLEVVSLTVTLGENNSDDDDGAGSNDNLSYELTLETYHLPVREE